MVDMMRVYIDEEDGESVPFQRSKSLMTENFVIRALI